MKTILQKIREDLFSMQDLPFRDFQAKLIPDIDKEKVIGVRTPDLRRYAKGIAGSPDIGEFLGNLPHCYYEENNLHAFLIERIRDYENCITEVKRFLPFVDNWATCDMFAPKIFARHKEELLDEIRKWIASGKTYTVRYGIGMLMRFFLDEDFRPEYPEMVSRIRSEEYYVNMMTAWYFATALAKQYEAVIPYFEKQRLDDWTHNKAIQKACESRRITPQQKEYLRTLKVRKNGKGNGGL